ncbi:uncharacterized protein LOC120084110 [Benincasa hispida]|uniref:uncharacterized protein LOC120084110 n=1 Tax=Benincasa hispida TaxID=102211 RepID=UPI00190291DE|nr:uncharacterized protein LOC120084110 [Benincasa hispida]
MGQTSVATFNDTNYNDPSLASNGLSLMSGLASSAPHQNLMFQTDVLDAGLRGKRYGMPQCTRDISGSECAQCLNSQLDAFRTTIGILLQVEDGLSIWWPNNFRFTCSVNDGSDDNPLAAQSWNILYLRMEVLNLRLEVFPSPIVLIREKEEN